MNGIERIVVGFDHGETSWSALKWAIEFAENEEVPIHVVSVWHHPWWASIPAPFNPVPTPDSGEIQQALEESLSLALTNHGHPSLPVTTVVLEGEVAGNLNNEAGPQDLLVVGTRGHGSLGSVLGGSVSARIVAHTTGPVAVIPLDWEAEESDTAVVAVDGSENAAKAAEWAGRHLSYLKAVTVLSAWEVPALAIPPDPTIYEQLGDDARMLAEEHTRSAAKSLAVWRSEESITEVVEHGFAREVVRRWAHGAQVLVVGARGHRDLLHGLLGSVTSSVIHRPPCPIIVVPHE